MLPERGSESFLGEEGAAELTLAADAGTDTLPLASAWIEAARSTLIVGGGEDLGSSVGITLGDGGLGGAAVRGALRVAGESGDDRESVAAAALTEVPALAAESGRGPMEAELEAGTRGDTNDTLGRMLSELRSAWALTWVGVAEWGGMAG